MTGLNPDTNTILQISCFITDSQLNVINDQGFDAVIHHPKSTLDKMDAWCTQTHASTGLTAAAIKSTTHAEEAASSLLAYVKQHVPTPRTALLAGNSVHADRAFLCKKPYDKVLEHLHYRILDVSSIKEAVRRWAPDNVLKAAPAKKELHEARQDILESIEEARFYRETFFKKADTGA